MSAGRDEGEWRRFAEEISPLLGTLLPDPGEAAELRRRIDRALALPAGSAKARLRRMLTGRPELRRWLRAQNEREQGYRAAPVPAERFLEAAMAEKITVGRRVPMFVRIVLGPADGLAPLKSLDVPPEGAKVVIAVWAPDLIAVGELMQELTVPAEADSEPVQFGFIAPVAGLHRVLVRAFRGGTFLGETAVQLSAGEAAGSREETVHTAEITSMAVEPGEVTLQVSRESDHYEFQLLGDALHSPQRSGRVAGDPAAFIERLTRQLGRMASGEADLDGPARVRRRLRNLGAALWSDVVPEAVHDQFWRQADRITSFTVASNVDDVPWELLYPVNGDNENGFLAEWVPIVRRVYGQERVRRLALPRATYVVPPPGTAPGDEHEVYRQEVAAVRARLCGLDDGGVIDDLDDLQDMIDDGPAGILHFAGHHGFDAGTGGFVRLHGGAFCPGDLQTAVQRGSWRDSPLVFFNGCRTAGQAPRLVRTTGWAEQFMRAGAGAFIGSLWAVRSSSARRFADHFYDHFHERRQPLGRASQLARMAIKEEAGDPTWLAYSVYGNPAATVAGGTGGASPG